VLSPSTELPERGTLLHTVGLVYRAEIRGGALRDEVAGSSDKAAWLAVDEALALPLAPFVGEVLVHRPDVS
jgi:8-oxo-dGTP diphosphatase